MDHDVLYFIGFLRLILLVISVKGTPKVIDARSQDINRDGVHSGVAYANFKAHKFSYLNISSLATTYVLKGNECGTACVNIPSCFSFNLAAFFDLTNLKILCELLPSDKYNNSQTFVSSQSFHHYSIGSPCMRAPCQNSAACKPVYENNSYSCLCTKQYTGKNCEALVPPGKFDESTILAGVDQKYADQLVSYLEPVMKSSNSTFVMCWSGKTDGWLAQKFHDNCDGKGPTVTIIKVGDHIFGGYTNEDWHSDNLCPYKPASKAFLFSLHNVEGYNPVKLAQMAGKESKAMRNCHNYGPTFGDGNDIVIWNDAGNTRQSYTSCGHGYVAPQGYSIAEQVASGLQCDFFAGSFQFTPDEVEVLYETSG